MRSLLIILFVCFIIAHPARATTWDEPWHDTIGDPPALPDVSAIRELLLREPIVWESRVAFDDTVVAEMRGVQMRVARTLVASALTKARAHDLAAWEDLHAAWTSRCSDGGWTFDGTTLRFSREIATAAPDMPVPLVLEVKP